MRVDDETLARWVQESQAKLALRDLTAEQLAVVRRISGRVAVKSTHLATIKNALRDLLRATKSRDLEVVLGLVQSAIMALRTMEPRAEGEAEVLPEVHKTPAERMQEMDDYFKSIQEKQKDEILTDMANQMEVRMKAILSSQPPPLGPSSALPSPEEPTDEATRRAMTQIDMDVRAAHEDDAAADLRAKMREEIGRAKRG